ncbi:hypothetical protein [Streptomyces sp. NPDC088725]|uniref:hypothetical protein n=1 Tax=Streptomyces sp. NPDC088725 TaxID=3365873 RepID=UPI00381CAE98
MISSSEGPGESVESEDPVRERGDPAGRADPGGSGWPAGAEGDAGAGRGGQDGDEAAEYGDPDGDEGAEYGDPDDDLSYWADDESLLADRTAAMLWLTGRGLAVERLLLLWGAGLAAVLGWAAVGLAVQSFEAVGLGTASGLVALGLGVVLLVPAVIVAGVWIGRGQDIRRQLVDWAGLGPVPVTDARLRAQRRCVLWLLPSAALCVAGVVATVRALVRPAAVTVGETVYALGFGGTVLLTGLFGVVQAVGHQLWSGTLLNAVPVRRRGGAHR